MLLKTLGRQCLAEMAKNRYYPIADFRVSNFEFRFLIAD